MVIQDMPAGAQKLCALVVSTTPDNDPAEYRRQLLAIATDEGNAREVRSSAAEMVMHGDIRRERDNGE